MPPKIQSYIKEIEYTSTEKNDNLNNLPSLESLVSIIARRQSADPIDQIWHDKLTILRLRLSSLIQSLRTRQKLKDDNIYNINKDICQIHTQQFSIKNDALKKYSPSNELLGLEKAVCNLEGEKRSEVLNCWKDLSMIQRDLVECISDYISLKRKMNLLNIKPDPTYHG